MEGCPHYPTGVVRNALGTITTEPDMIIPHARHIFLFFRGTQGGRLDRPCVPPPIPTGIVWMWDAIENTVTARLPAFLRQPTRSFIFVLVVFPVF